MSQQEVQVPKKREMPPVKHSSIIVIVLFAILFALGYYFFPYLQMWASFGGSTIRGSVYGITEARMQDLTAEADLSTVIIGKVTFKSEPVRDTSVIPDDGLGFIVYREVSVSVDQVLFGEPVYQSGNTLITYELGGSYLSSQNGRPQKFNVVYDNAANLPVNETVLLFLDNAGNILHERYGVFRQHSDGYFYDYANRVYSLETIRASLASRKN